MVFQLDNVKQTARVASLNMECTVHGFKGTRSNLCFLQINGYEHFPDKWTLDVQHTILIRIANGGSQCGLELHPLELDSMSDAIGIKFDEYELGESFFHIRTPILE
jgi:hypothetical protein